ncbi:SAV_915 family protein [Streptacidiphilus sp. MAP5-3]|uniref:SAV_915 family protein n=1 Tax=unclassified Streptacidiphilus TaxID=2643834 RepID=UPI003518436B
MVQMLCGSDPEPSERVPAGLLLIPVRSGPAGSVVRLFRTPLGERTAVAFTTRRQLAAVLGEAQQCVALAEDVVRAMTEPLGVTRLLVDPQLAALPAGRLRHDASWEHWESSLEGSTHLRIA